MTSVMQPVEYPWKVYPRCIGWTNVKKKKKEKKLGDVFQHIEGTKILQIKFTPG